MLLFPNFIPRNITINRQRKVIIIGAGAAGIAAAARLIENGITDILILEAEDRIGGRIHTEWMGQAFVDLGADLVRGQEGNLVTELAQGSLRPKMSLTQSTCYYSDSTRIDYDISSDVLHLLEEFCEENINAPRSIGDLFVEKFMTSETLTKYKQDLAVWRKISDFIPLCNSFFCVLEGAFTWTDVVLKSASHYVKCEGDQFMGFNGRGCSVVLDNLIKKINSLQRVVMKDILLLNKTVFSIWWKMGYERGYVRITCQDGSIYDADHIIFTPSASVMKLQQQLFFPPLPPEKEAALQCIGYGNIVKVALKFPTKWWHSTPFAFVWSRESLVTDYSRWANAPTMPDGTSCLTAIKWAISSPDNDLVLIVLATGPATPLFEAMSNEQMKHAVMLVLQKFLGAYFTFMPLPDFIISSKWWTNQNFGGAYSFETVDSSQQDVPLQKILEEPLPGIDRVPRLLFAGEATHVTQYSTVNGALLSGYREADRLIELFRNE